jgi:hypothetical protein
MTASSYRFLRVREGITSFALVAVELDPGEAESLVRLRLGDPDEDAGEVSASSEPGWCGAAERGARRALDRFSGQLSSRRCSVTITKIVGSPIDTREDAVEVAAAIATTRALGDRFAADPVWNGERWDVELRIAR